MSPTVDIDAHMLSTLLAGPTPPHVVDVRSPAEFAAAHIPGSYNVPLDTVQQHREHLAAALARGAVLVCRSGQRATQACTALAGHLTVTTSPDPTPTGPAPTAPTAPPVLQVLHGGMLGWQAAGLPVVHGRTRWELERQVRLVAGLLVATGALGSLVAPPLVWLAAAVGVGLTGAALTDSCLMGLALAKLPYNTGTGPDPAAELSRLTAACTRPG